MKKNFIFATAFFVLVGASCPLHAAEHAQEGVEAFIKAIRAMKFPVQDATSQELVKNANSYLDLEAMSKKALDPHWDSRSEEQRADFLNLMWKLIENVAYPKSSRFMGNYVITFPEVAPAGNGFDVYSVIKHEEEGLDAEVIYHVYLKGAQPKIDDVILDGVSITEDLKYQFDKIIEESAFSGLIETMQKRLSEAVKQNETPAAQ